jgi:hypothetical protein
MGLTGNPFDPHSINLSDLVSLRIGERVGVGKLREQVEKYERMLSSFQAEDFNDHSVAVLGPYQGGRTSFLTILLGCLERRIRELGIDPDGLFQFRNHPRSEMALERGPNAALKEILLDLLSKMDDDLGGRFDGSAIDTTIRAISRAEKLEDISNAFFEEMRRSLKSLKVPLLLVFENLISQGLYGYLRRTFLHVHSIIFISAYLQTPTATEFERLHDKDPRAWSAHLDSLDCAEITALVEHNLERRRAQSRTDLFPFAPLAIEGFFAGPAKKQPMGRMMRACYGSIESRAAELEANASANVIIDHKDMLEALERRSRW